jgi:hypothetical protein
MFLFASFISGRSRRVISAGGTPARLIEFGLVSRVNVDGVKFGLGCEAEREFKRMMGIAREIHSNEDSAVRTVRRAVDHQHRPVSLANDLLRSRPEQYIF